MPYFLSGQINCLDSQVEAYASAHSGAMGCFDVEELVSLFVLLAAEFEKWAAKQELSTTVRRDLIAGFGRLASLGGRIRSMVQRLRENGYTVTGVDGFLRSLIRCRAAADSDEIAAERRQVDRRDIKTRPVQELIDQLQRRDDTAGG